MVDQLKLNWLPPKLWPLPNFRTRSLRPYDVGIPPSYDPQLPNAIAPPPLPCGLQKTYGALWGGLSKHVQCTKPHKFRAYSARIRHPVRILLTFCPHFAISSIFAGQRYLCCILALICLLPLLLLLLSQTLLWLVQTVSSSLFTYTDNLLSG